MKEIIPHKHEHYGIDWRGCTLCRSHQQSQDLLRRTKQRQIIWPNPKEYKKPPIEDPVIYTSVDDAFASVIQSMTSASRQCKRYYRSCKDDGLENEDVAHCQRFHTPAYTTAQRSNPLQRAEDVHLVVHPGTYAVTAGEWGTQQQQTHMVHVEKGQSVDLDFVM